MNETFRMFLEYLVTAAGLGAVSTFVTQFAKNQLNWEGPKALWLNVVTTVLVGVGAMLLLRYELFVYVEEFWPLIVALVTVLGGSFLSSQLFYHKMPKSNDGS